MAKSELLLGVATGQALFDGAVLRFPCVNRDWARQAGRFRHVRKCPESDGWPPKRSPLRWANCCHARQAECRR
jgi:hypothetical protein